METKIIRCGLEEAYNNDYLFIRWELNKYCNLNCSYCELHNNIKKFQTKDNLFKIVDFIKSFKRDIINISITGGEPTVNPHFLEVVEYIVDSINVFNKKYFSIFTNLTATKQQLNSFWKLIEKFTGNFRLNCSYHGEIINYNKFKSNIIHCLNLGFPLIVRFMIDSNDIDKLKTEYFDLKQLDCIVIPEFVHGFQYDDIVLNWYDNLKIEKQEDRQIFIDYLDAVDCTHRKYISNDQINYYQLYKSRGFYCYVGSKHLLIKNSGDVSLCYSYDKLLGPIFNILDTSQNIIDNKLKLYNKPIRCINKECYCETWVPRFIKGHENFNDT